LKKLKKKTDDGITISHNNTKFDFNILYFAKKNIKLIMKVEDTIEKALKSQSQSTTHEIPNLNKKEWVVVYEFLKTYYNIAIEKKSSDLNRLRNIVLKDVSASTIPRIRLSLLGVLFKNHYFITDPRIFHPFEATISLFNYRYSTTDDEIEKFLLTFCESSDFYLDQITAGKGYAHFFKREVGEKVFLNIKSHTSQFQDCELKTYEKQNDDYKKSIQLLK